MIDPRTLVSSSSPHALLFSGQYTPPSGTAPIFCRKPLPQTAKVGNSRSRYHPNAMVQSFSDKLGDWRNEAPLPTARSYLAATALKGQLYALGGFDGTLGNRYLATVEKYCPLMDTWVSCSPLPSERSHLASAAYGNSIYVFGGYCSGAAVSYVDVYDVVTDEWKRGPCMPTARDSLAAAVLNGKFFALGGCTSGGVTSLASVESFDHRSVSSSPAPSPSYSSCRASGKQKRPCRPLELCWALLCLMTASSW